jgi:AhpD family alkylhydroperoxidase
MNPRIDLNAQLSSPALKAMLGLQHVVQTSGLEHSLVSLVKIRASQINGCAYCIDMHTKDARAEGETEQRIYALNAWRETPFFSDRERAALEWAETLTLISQNQVPDEIYDRVREHFNEKDLISLTMAVIAINAWNRLAITFRAPAGSYKRPEAVSV